MSGRGASPLLFVGGRFCPGGRDQASRQQVRVKFAIDRRPAAVGLSRRELPRETFFVEPLDETVHPPETDASSKASRYSIPF